MSFSRHFKNIFNTIDKFYCFIIFCWPFAYFFRYVIFLRKIGSDFSGLYYNYKVYLLANLSHFKFPCWSPSEGGGFSFLANPFAQSFYPLNLLLTPFYFLTHGYSKYEYQLFTILGVSIFAIGIYLWLRKLNYSAHASLFSALLISMNYKLTEILRFPNAVHAAAWLPFVLLGITMALNKTSEKKSFILIISSTILLITAGYPYYIYYSLFLFIPYIILLNFSKTRENLIGQKIIASKKYLFIAFTSLFLGFVICSPYLLKISQLMNLTVDRAGASFNYSTEHIFSFMDTMGSLFYPPAAQAEGWYFFSAIALFVILFYLLNIFLTQIPKYKNIGFVTILFSWFLVISFLTYGKYSLLFKFCWHYLPGFAALRVWGRMNIILLPLFALVLAKAYSYLTEWLKLKKQPSKLLPTIFGITLCYLGILIWQIYIFKNRLFDGYWLNYFSQLISGAELFYILTGACSFLLFIYLITVRHKSFKPKYLLIILIAMASLDLGIIGGIQWSLPGAARPTKYYLNMQHINNSAFTTPRVWAAHTISLDSTFYLLPVPNWYYKTYVDFLNNHRRESTELKQLLGVYTGQRLFFTDSLNYFKVSDFLAAAKNREKLYKIEKISYSGDSLNVLINNQTPGYLCFIDNWDPNWLVIINNHPAKLEKLFKTFKAVWLPIGKNRVLFLYRPRFF